MEYCYVDNMLPEQIEDLVDANLHGVKDIRDRTKRITYIKIGSGFDIETSRVQYQDKDYAYCYHWQFGIGQTAFMGRSLTTMYSFMKSVIEVVKYTKPKARILVLDANLGYEWQFCKRYWQRLGITDLFAKEKRNPIYIEVANTFVFREVIGLFGHSLAEIATNHCGMEKLVGDLDYSKRILSNTPMDEKEIGYCVRDVEILVKLGDKIFENYFGQKPTLPYTSTGIVRAEIKKALGANLKSERKRIESLMPEEWEYEIFRTKLFKGGICGSNIMLMDRILEDVVGADITSDYPFQMLTKQFPVGGTTRCKPNEFMTEKIPYIAWVRFHKFKSRTSHALMSAHKLMNKEESKKSRETVLDNNRIQYLEFAELVINDVEYESLKKAYKWEHMTVKHCWKFTEGYAMLPAHIRKTVISWYLKKEKLKAEYSDTQEYRDAKAFVNSIFGMMCTALYLEDFELDEDSCEIVGEKTNDYAECCKYLFLSPYWGFWITSHARAMLMDVICRFPSIIVQYDTDSVYFRDNGSEASIGLRKYLENYNKLREAKNMALFLNDEHMRTIGTWEIDKMYKRFKGLGSKRYMYEKQNGTIKCVVAGCRKSKKPGKEGVSTIVIQNEYNNLTRNEDVDVFDFFSNKMVIDEEHSEKLCSLYVEDHVRFTSTDYLGNAEEIDIPSCVVLKEIPFNMSLGRRHLNLLIAIKRENENTKGKAVYDIWRKAQKLRSNILTTTLTSASTTTGNSSRKSTKSSESRRNTTSQTSCR